MDEKQPYLQTAAVKLPQTLLDEVDRLAVREDRTRSAMIRRLIRQALDALDARNP